MNKNAPITDAQVDYLWSLIKAGRHESPNVIDGPTTLDGIKALTRGQASEYIDSIKNPQAPVPVDENGEQLSAYVTVRVSSNASTTVVTWDMVAPGVTPAGGVHSSAADAARKIYWGAQGFGSGSTAAPYGYMVEGITATDTTLTSGAYRMRPITQAEEDARQAKRQETAGLSLMERAALNSAARQA